ncbi:MAG: hypothetical protein PVF96_06150 [Candidatus Bathyarchaeota archaeon]
MKITSIIKAGLNVTQLLLELFLIWVTLDLKVRRARKAFEKELIKAGMAKNVARRLSEKYSSVKDAVMGQLWRSAVKMRSSTFIE